MKRIFALALAVVLCLGCLAACSGGKTTESKTIKIGYLGPLSGNVAQYGIAEKLLLTAAMLLGRLEIYPLLFAFSPSTWTGKKS